MASLLDIPTCDYFINFKFEQTNFLYMRDLARYTTIYKPNALFVIMGMENIPRALAKYQVPSSWISDGVITDSTKFVNGDRELFLKLCKERKNVHLFEFNGRNSCFKWIEASIGADVAVFREHCMSISVTHILNEFELKFDRPVTIIFAGYGMGKTTCLHYIRQKLIVENKSKFILYVNDIELRKLFQTYSVANVRDFVHFFSIDLTNPDVHIMFDNFEHMKECENIIDVITDFHLNYRQVKQWITCSEIECRNKLESKLGTFACFLAPVSSDYQRMYLKYVWDIECNEYDDYIDSVIWECNMCYWKDNRGLQNHTSSDYCGFSNYPLHLKMMGAKFKPINKTKVKDICVLDVYEYYVHNIYTNENVEELAVIKLFENSGIDYEFVRDDSVTFECVNVINYLAAKWFSKNFQKYKSEFQLLLKSGFRRWSFIHFFNSFLSRGKILHMAVLSHGDVETACSEMTVNERDAGGRTVLHLVEDNYTMYSLFRKGAQADLTDDVLQWTPSQYFDILGKLKCLDVLLEHNADVNKLTWTLSLSKSEISKRVNYSFTSCPKLPHYVKFVCQNFEHFQVNPESIGESFYTIPEDVRMMLFNHAEKSNTTYVCYFGKTALHYAVEYNHFDCVQLLINKLGFDIHHRCYANATPFHMACENGYIDIAEYLLDLGADINATHGNNNSNAFLDCCRHNKIEVMELLVRRGAATNVVLKSGETPIEVACNNGSYDIVKYLFKNAANLNMNFKVDTDQLLYGAVVSKTKDLVEFILTQENVNINKKYNGTTLLHLACNNDYDYEVDIIKMLIHAGADVNATDNEGCTPVFKIFNSDNVEVVKILAQNGCNLLHRNNEGETVLHVFTKKCWEVYGAEGDNFHDLSELIKHLIIYGAEVNSRTTSGDTPLHFASRNNIIELIECLVSQGADIHAVNNKGESPLHLGSLRMCSDYNTDFKTCKYLVSKGADVNQRTYSGKTPIMYAVEYPPNIDELLLVGADISCKDNDNKTLVHYFAEKGLLHYLEMLADLGIKDAKTVDVSGKTPLHVAAENYNFDCFKYLIENFDVDINIVDNNGKTAVELSADMKRRQMDY